MQGELNSEWTAIGECSADTALPDGNNLLDSEAPPNLEDGVKDTSHKLKRLLASMEYALVAIKREAFKR